MKIEIEVPDPPKGWVYDTVRVAMNFEEKWWSGYEWRNGHTQYAYPVAIKVKPHLGGAE